MVRGVGFEPTNPYGTGYPIIFDLESYAHTAHGISRMLRASDPSLLFDLALPPPQFHQIWADGQTQYLETFYRLLNFLR